MNPLAEINLEYERRLEASEERRKQLDLMFAGDATAAEIVAGIEEQVAKDVLIEYGHLAAATFGAEGGHAGAAAMTPEERRERARKAGKAGGRGRTKSA
jgi:hypothetical protein